MLKFIKHIILKILIILFVIPSFAQARMELLNGRKKQKLSFEFINNVIIIPVYINGKKLSFILDTGARNTILFGSTKSDSLVLNNKIKTKIRGLGDGEPINAIISRNNRINIKNIYGYNQTLYVLLDDSFNLSLKMGKPIHGIIGYELLKDFVISINYRTRKLIFYDASNYKLPKSKKYQKFALDFYHNKPYINAVSQLTDSLSHQTKLLIDTGCSDALWLFENYNTGLTIQGKFFTDYLGEGLNGSIIGKRSKIISFKLGTFTFKNITTAFLDSVSTSYARSFKERDGSIGSSLLERFHVIIDYPRKKLYLKKAKRFDKEFRYNRAGLGIAFHKDAKILSFDKNQSQIIISEHNDGSYNNLFEISYKYQLKRLFNVYYIRPNSPAERAGLKVNDIIHKLNGKPAYDYSLDEIVNFFYGDKGETIKLIIERNGSQFYYEFKLEEPLQIF